MKMKPVHVSGIAEGVDLLHKHSIKEGKLILAEIPIHSRSAMLSPKPDNTLRFCNQNHLIFTNFSTDIIKSFSIS